MSEDFMDFQQELRETTKSAVDYSQMYLAARREKAHFENQLLVLLTKAGLQKSKKSIDNKIAELISDPTYGETAQQYLQGKLAAEADYKGLELVVKSHIAPASGLQSIIKAQQSGELEEAMRRKYGSREVVS